MATITLYEDETMTEKCGHDFKIITGNINIGSYASNGVSMDLSKQIPTKVHAVLVESDGGYIGSYDETNKKLKVYYADYDAEADGALIEVADQTDLAAVNMRFVAIGK